MKCELIKHNPEKEPQLYKWGDLQPGEALISGSGNIRLKIDHYNYLMRNTDGNIYNYRASIWGETIGTLIKVELFMKILY